MTIGKHKFSHSYIPASYIKWVEMNNARVIPIPYDTPKGTLDMILSQINGILFIIRDYKKLSKHLEPL